MSESATARIAVAAATYWLDRPYSYRIPASLQDRILPGVRVVVPFGRGNRRTEGIVLSVGPTPPDAKGLKAIASVLDSESVLSEEMIRLSIWLHDRYFCSVYVAIHAMLPAGLWYRLEEAYAVCSGVDRETAYGAADGSEAETLILDALFSHEGSCPARDIRIVFEGRDPSRALQSLVRKGIIEPDSRTKRRIGDKNVRMI